MTNEDLVIQIKEGHPDLIGELYLKNYSLIRKYVRRFASPDNIDDLSQESYFAIIEAVKNWNPEKNVGFMKYALYWIKSVVIRYLQRNESGISIPYHIIDKRSIYRHYTDEYMKQHGRDPTREEIMQHTGFSSDQIEDIQRSIQAESLMSLYQECKVAADDREGLMVIDTVLDPSDQVGELMDKMQAEELSEKMWDVVRSLPEQQSKVIQYRYYHGLTLNECGMELGVSPDRIRRVEKEALNKMRTVYRKELQPFVDDYVYQQGLKNTGLTSFRNTFESSTERAAIKLEKLHNRCKIL